MLCFYELSYFTVLLVVGVANGESEFFEGVDLLEADANGDSSISILDILLIADLVLA